MPPAVIAAGVSGVASLGSAAISGSASKKAANAQAQAAADANAAQERMFNRQVELQEPFRQAGITANNRILDLLGLSQNTGADGFGKYGRDFSMQDFEADPGYDFRFKEGMKALNNSMAAKGLGVSGAGIKGAQQYGQGLASQEYQNAFNRYQVNRSNQLNPLQSMSGAGQSATNVLTGAAGNLGNAQADNALQAGNARASGYIGSSNALTNALSGGINSFIGLRNLQNSGGSGGWNPYANGYEFGPGG